MIDVNYYNKLLGKNNMHDDLYVKKLEKENSALLQKITEIEEENQKLLDEINKADPSYLVNAVKNNDSIVEILSENILKDINEKIEDDLKASLMIASNNFQNFKNKLIVDKLIHKENYIIENESQP